MPSVGKGIYITELGVSISHRDAGKGQSAGPERGQKAGFPGAWAELIATQSPKVNCNRAWKQGPSCKDFVGRD